MLQIIAGRSGSGKTEEVFKRIYQEKNFSSVILLVPEQSSFQSEKRILDDLGAKKASQVTVLSFRRLCDRIFELYGGRTGKRADDGDKAVLMSLAAAQTADQLTLYGGKTMRSDIVELMLRVVSEYKMCAITPEQLLTAAKNIDNSRLKQKIFESAAVYEAYQAILGKTYCDPDDDLTFLYKVLCDHPYFVGKKVYIDSFNGFSGQETKIVECIIQQAAHTVVTLGCARESVSDTEHSFFAEPNKTRLILKALAEKNHIVVADDIWLEEQKRFVSDGLAAVEESVFRFDSDPYNDDEAVNLYCAQDKYDEIQQAARDIMALVRRDGYAYRDITVICRDSAGYKNIITSEFPKFDIPFFMSYPQPLENKPLIKLVLSAFETVHHSFDTEKLFSYLKTGLTNVDVNEVFLLENYAYMWDIRGKAWKQPFTLNPDGNTGKENKEELQQLEEIRQRAIAPLTHFAKEIQKAENGGQISKAVFMLLERMNTAEKLKKLVGRFDALGELKAKEEQARIWEIMMNLLDKMHTILSDTPIDSKRYYELLQLMIAKTPVSDIPQTLDSVTVGTAGNIRSENPRAVFVIGAVENSFPAVPQETGIFSDNEREKLIEAHLPLYETLYAAALKEKYIAYSALSAAKEKLFVSWYITELGGDHCEKSVIVREIEEMFDGIRSRIRCRQQLNDSDLFFTPRQSFEICASEWNDNTQRSETLKKYFISDPNYSAKTFAIEKIVMDVPFFLQNPQIPKKLFGEKPVLSASQIEQYYSCPFAYFCRYGLRTVPKRRAEGDPSIYGSAVHYILEKILSEMDFAELKQSDDHHLNELAEKYLLEYIETIGGTAQRTHRFMSQCRTMQKNIVIVLERLIEEFENSSFEPTDFELTINDDRGSIPSYTLELPNGETASVIGKVDRVDTFVKNGKKYIRIIDYKTGNKKFRLSDVLYGLNIQMLLYLSAIRKNGVSYYSENDSQTLIPAGVLYMPSTPKAETAEYHSENNRKELLQERKKAFKMNGIVIDDLTAITAMENDIKGLYIPVSMKKDGTFSSSSSLAKLEDFGKIFEYIDKKITTMAQSLLSGNIERMPSKGSVDACQYCDYKNVCGYEEGKKCRRVSVLKTQAALEKMKGETEINE